MSPRHVARTVPAEEENQAIDREAVFGVRPGHAERIAPGYFPAGIVRVHEQRYRWIRPRLRGLRVLDAGCGTGYGLASLQPAGSGLAVGFDLHEAALSFGLGEYELGGRVLRADGSRLPFSDCVFGAVTAFEFIEHLHDQAEFLAEARRVLAPGGLLAVSTPNPGLSDGSNPYHVHELGIEDLRTLIRETGFEIQRVVGQSWRLAHGWVHQIPVVRRAAYELQTRYGVRDWRLPVRAEPEVWCVLASRT